MEPAYPKPGYSKPKHAVQRHDLGHLAQSVVKVTLQCLAQSVVQVTSQWLEDEVKERQETLYRLGCHKLGSICASYPCAFIGINTGLGVHLDDNDLYSATWGALGCNCGLALPEFGVVVSLPHGSVCTFDSTKFYHCSVRCPCSIGDSVIFSLYYNRKQHEKFVEHHEKNLKH